MSSGNYVPPKLAEELRKACERHVLRGDQLAKIRALVHLGRMRFGLHYFDMQKASGLELPEWESLMADIDVEESDGE